MRQRPKRTKRRHKTALDREPVARAGTWALLQLLAETRVAAGLDADASGAIGRFMGILGEQVEVSRAMGPGTDTPFTPDLDTAREALQIKARAGEPILARIAHPSRRA